MNIFKLFLFSLGVSAFSSSQKIYAVESGILVKKGPAGSSSTANPNLDAKQIGEQMLKEVKGHMDSVMDWNTKSNLQQGGIITNLEFSPFKQMITTKALSFQEVEKLEYVLNEQKADNAGTVQKFWSDAIDHTVDIKKEKINLIKNSLNDKLQEIKSIKDQAQFFKFLKLSSSKPTNKEIQEHVNAYSKAIQKFDSPLELKELATQIVTSIDGVMLKLFPEIFEEGHDWGKDYNSAEDILAILKQINEQRKYGDAGGKTNFLNFLELGSSSNKSKITDALNAVSKKLNSMKSKLETINKIKEILSDLTIALIPELHGTDVKQVVVIGKK